MKIKYGRDINCYNCGNNNTAFVYNKKQKKFREIYLRCLDCGKERDLTHTEGSSYAIWQMDTKNWKELLLTK